jgi:hypothetical protein
MTTIGQDPSDVDAVYGHLETGSIPTTPPV